MGPRVMTRTPSAPFVYPRSATSSSDNPSLDTLGDREFSVPRQTLWKFMAKSSKNNFVGNIELLVHEVSATSSSDNPSLDTLPPAFKSPLSAP